MKVKLGPTPSMFVPVHLILETQGEVNALAALFSNSLVRNTLSMITGGNPLVPYADITIGYWVDKVDKALNTGNFEKVPL